MTWITDDLTELAGSWVVRQTPVTVVGDAVWHQVLKRNPLRWGLYFVLGLGAGGTLQLGLRSDAGPADGWALPAQTIQGWDYRSHPGLVQAEWFGLTPGPGNVTLTVWEELAQQ